MRWQLTKNKLPIPNGIFDDGLPGWPGEQNYTEDAVKAEVAKRADADGFTYFTVSAVEYE